MFGVDLAPFPRDSVEAFNVPVSANITRAVSTSADAVDGLTVLTEQMITGASTNTSDSLLKAAITDWMTITHKVMDYQYVNDINNYVKTVQEEERDRLNSQFHSITNDVMITKTVYTHTQRDAMLLYSRIRVLLHTILFVSVFAFLYANRFYMGVLAYGLLVLVSVAFGVYVIMHIKLSNSRSYDDWDRMRFNDAAMNTAAKAPSTTDPSGGMTCRNQTSMTNALNSVNVL